MLYRIFRFIFHEGVHIGEGSLEDRGIVIHADTIFSALCIEALKIGGESMLANLLSVARNNSFMLSDAFPYICDEFYMPKPIYRIQQTSEAYDTSAKKVFKKLRFIPLDMVDDYISGGFDKNTAEYISSRLESGLGKPSIMARAAVRRLGDTLPYHVGVFTFHKGAGLYIISGGDENAIRLFRELINNLSFAGIGGKRSSGLGKFLVEESPVPSDIVTRLTGEYKAYLTMNVSLPDDDGLKQALEGATYSLLRRSGYVFSDTYSDEMLRKNDLYVFISGSFFKFKYKGGIFDVSNNGAHPVYRYAKPLFMGVTL